MNESGQTTDMHLHGKKVLRETVCRFQWCGNTFRIWRGFHLNEEAHDNMDTTQYAMDAIEKVCLKPEHTAREVADEILRIKDVNAVEITGHDGNGIVFYADWP